MSKNLWLMILALGIGGCNHLHTSNRKGAGSDPVTGASALDSTALPASGVSAGGFIWHLAKAGESCTSACTAFGGVTAGTVSFAGQSLDQCTQVAAALGLPAAQGKTANRQPCDIGCYVSYGSYAWWYGGHVTQECQGIAAGQRLCSCAR